MYAYTLSTLWVAWMSSLLRRCVDDSSTEDPVRRKAEGCLVRGVRPGRGDELPRARVTITVSVRSELPRSRAGPGGRAHCCRVFLERVGIRS